METIAGYTTTGRQLRGPASDLVELSAQNGLRLTAIVFHPEYRGHRALNEALDVVRGFLESPLVTNLSELTAEDRSAGAFVYPTGQCWSAAEVIRALADIGESDGHIRAGLELMLAAGEILIEAAERGEMDGVYSHGGVTPWRLMLKKDGQVTVIGHALPQVEILQFHEDDSRIPREDSFRYCPPERIEFSPENISSDLFGLSLIAFELMTGRPVYDGLVNDIRQQAARGEGSRRLFRFRDKLPDSVRTLIGKALKPNIDDRYPSGEDFLYAVRQVLSGPDATGGSLMDLMGRVASRGQRTGQALQSSKTLMVSKDKLRAMLDDEEDEEPARKTWSAPARSRREAPRTRKAPEELPPQPPVVADDDAPQVTKPKWSKPTRRRQPAPRATEPDVQVEVAPPRPRSTADNAKDLLARLRASAANATPQHTSTVASARRSDANLVQSILSNSGPPPETTDAAISATPPPTPTPIPEPGPRIIPGRRRPPTRNKPTARSPEEIARLISQSMANTGSLVRNNADEEAARKRAEEEQAAAEEAARKKAAEEAARKQKAAAARKKAAAEAARKKAAAEEAARKKAAAEEAARKQKAAAEEAARKKAAAEASARKKAAAEETARKQKAAEAAARKKAAAEAARKKAAAEEAARKQKAAAEEAARNKKAAQEAAARKRMEAAARKQAEEAAAMAARQAEIERELVKELQAAAAAAQKKAAEERRLQEAAAARELAALRAEKERVEAEVASLRRELAASKKQRSAEIAAAVQAEVAALLKAQSEAEAGQAASMKRAVLDAVRSAPRPQAPSEGDAAFPKEVAAAVAGHVGFSGTGQLVRAPDSITMSSSREGVASFNFQRGPSGRTVRIRLPLSASAAEAVAWLLGSVLPVRADLQGHISGWYRIEHNGQIFPASRRLGELDAQQTYMLRFVPNRTVHADIDASAAGSPVRFVAPVGVAVPAVTLVDHLAAWLGLPAGDWMLEANGQLLGTYGIVHDVLQGEGLVRMRLLKRGTR